MRQQVHKRSRTASRTTAAFAALVLAGSGAAALAAHASAGQDEADSAGSTTAGSAPVRTVDCPDVGLAVGAVPEGAKTDVAKGVTELDQQVAAAYSRVASAGADEQRAEKVLSGLREKRAGTIAGMADAIAENGAKRPSSLESMSACALKEDKDAPAVRTTGQDGVQNGADGADGGVGGDFGDGGDLGGFGGSDGGDGGGAVDGGAEGGGDAGQQQPGGPVPEDFVDITTVAPNAEEPQGQDPQGQGDNGSTGTFTTECGKNEGGQFNSDNVIAAPGVSNGAHHVHDYVGNDSTDAFSDDNSLAAAGTSCDNGDLSTHYWPVLRALDGQQDEQQQDGQQADGQGHAGGGAHDGNVGTILTPAEVSLTFSGSQQGDVQPMPRFLRIITGDAKSFTNGTDNANASWSCEGFEDRQLTDKYPLCPEGSKVIRSLKFQSCWDGRNTDSGNHRDHVAFARDDGSCPEGFQAIPQLEQKVSYDVPQGGNIAPETPFAVDSFPEQLHKPVTDHGDFINVMPDQLMAEAVGCINSGQNCG